MKRQWYATPYALWMLIFTIVPLLFVCYYAFTTPEGAFTLDNIAKIFTYSPVLLDSLRLAFYCTVLCLLIFGKDRFLIPAMLLIALILCLYREEGDHA